MVLRPWRLNDLEAWTNLHLGPAIATPAHDQDDSSPTELAEALARSVLSWTSTDPGPFACEPLRPHEINDGPPAEPIGSIEFIESALASEGVPAREIKWRFSFDAGGTDHLVEAATAALMWAFQHYDLYRIIATVAVGNRQSIAVAENLGMVAGYRTISPERTRWADVFELTAEELRTRP